MLIYERLLEEFGPQGWWPGESDFETIVGAILTQNTNWKNVEKALGVMKGQGVLDARALRAVPGAELAEMIRPTGYYKQKAKKLAAFLDYFFDNYDGDTQRLSKQDLDVLRAELLGVWGIGEETADAIILYAAHQPTFVIDAYTRRVFSRMGFVSGDAAYGELKGFFEATVPRDLYVFKEFHALIDELAKRFCKTRPDCDGCPVSDLCGFKEKGKGKDR